MVGRLERHKKLEDFACPSLSVSRILVDNMSSVPHASSEQPQRIANTDSFRDSRKIRASVTTKSPPPLVNLVVGEYKQADMIDAVTVNSDATMCAASTADNITSIWSWPSGTSRGSAGSEHISPQLYNSLYQPSSSQHIFTLKTGAGTQCLSFSPDSPLILSGTSRGTVDLWSIEKEAKLVSFIGHSSRTPVWDVSHAPSGLYFATASGDSAARIWRTDIPYPVRCFKAENATHAHFVRWHPSAQIVAVATNVNLSIYDVGTSQPVFQFNDFAGCTALEFSPSGYLLAAANEKCLRIWETATGACIFNYDTFSTILSLAWSFPTGSGLDGGVKGPNGTVSGGGHSVLMSVEESGRTRMWDRLSISKPSACELMPDHVIRPLHMHFTPRNLLVVAGVRECPDVGSLQTAVHCGGVDQ